MARFDKTWILKTNMYCELKPRTWSGWTSEERQRASEAMYTALDKLKVDESDPVWQELQGFEMPKKAIKVTTKPVEKVVEKHVQKPVEKPIEKPIIKESNKREGEKIERNTEAEKPKKSVTSKEVGKSKHVEKSKSHVESVKARRITVEKVKDPEKKSEKKPEKPVLKSTEKPVEEDKLKKAPSTVKKVKKIEKEPRVQTKEDLVQLQEQFARVYSEYRKLYDELAASEQNIRSIFEMKEHGQIVDEAQADQAVEKFVGPAAARTWRRYRLLGDWIKQAKAEASRAIRENSWS